MAERVEAVVLAAGLSSRCPDYKLTLPWGKRSNGEPRTLIEQTLSGMLSVVQRAIVVLGHNDGAVRQVLAGEERVTCVLNPAYRQGMFSSVRAGLRAADADAVFVQPGDIPMVPEAVYRVLLACDSSVAIPTFGDRKGHPVLMRQKVIDDVLSAPPDDTLRDVLSRWGFQRVPVDDEAILWDVDTIDDYHLLLAEHERRLENEE